MEYESNAPYGPFMFPKEEKQYFSLFFAQFRTKHMRQESEHELGHVKNERKHLYQHWTNEKWIFIDLSMDMI